jgi:hypothetical protein
MLEFFDSFIKPLNQICIVHELLVPFQNYAKQLPLLHYSCFHTYDRHHYL